MVTANEERIQDYINHLLKGDAVILKPPSVPRVISTRACLHCGKEYQINIPYEKCVPGNRDLCDACIVKGVRLT